MLPADVDGLIKCADQSHKHNEKNLRGEDIPETTKNTTAEVVMSCDRCDSSDKQHYQRKHEE